jgi:hypothetical protein
MVTASSKHKAAIGNTEAGILFGANVRSEGERYEWAFQLDKLQACLSFARTPKGRSTSGDE